MHTLVELEKYKLEGVKLVVRPNQIPQTWDEFRKWEPPFSIALDGYLNSSPAFDPIGPYANFDHHFGVDRLATRATCAQALLSIRQGLFERFQEENKARAQVYVNDCDEDVCIASFILKYGGLAKQVHNPLLNKLVSINDYLDTTAATYPIPIESIDLREYYWILDPYKTVRLNGNLDQKDAETYEKVILDVEERILRYLSGQGEKITLDPRFEVLRQGHGWSMVRELGAHAKHGMVNEDIKAFVSVRERPNGYFTYTLGRVSPYIPFEIDRFYDILNKIEGADKDKWGGSNIVGGSPRVKGSIINPDNLFNIIENLQNEKQI